MYIYNYIYIYFVNWYNAIIVAVCQKDGFIYAVYMCGFSIIINLNNNLLTTD